MKFDIDKAISAMRRYHVACEKGSTETIIPYLKEQGYTGKLFGDCCMQALKDSNYLYCRANKKGELEYVWRHELPFEIDDVKSIAELAFDLQKDIIKNNISSGRQKKVCIVEEAKEATSTDVSICSFKEELSNLRELNTLFVQQMSVVNKMIEKLSDNGVIVHFDPVSLSATVEI